MVEIKKDELYNRLRNRIQEGEYPVGYRFPPETELASQLGVARNTLRSALKRLECDNLIARVKSKGTFVKSSGFSGQRILVLSHLVNQTYYPYHYIYPGIKAMAEENGYLADLCDIAAFSVYSPQQLAELISKQHIAGLILIASNFQGNEPCLELLKTVSVPVILAHCDERDWQITGFPAVLSDTRGAWMAAVRTLADAGHRRILMTSIAYPDGNIRGISPAEMAALYRELDLDPDPELRFALKTFDELRIEENIFRIFHRPNPPTAVLAFSDFWAPAIYRALKRLGAEIPKDVAVAGFCGMPGGDYLIPPLSTVDLNYEHSGRLAVKLILDASQWYGIPEMVAPRLAVGYTIRHKASTAVRRFEYAY